MSRGAAGRALALVALGAVACSPPRDAPPAPEVAWSGCTEVALGPVCHLPPDGGRLVLWVAPTATCPDPAAAEVAEGGTVAERGLDGARLAIDVPTGAQRLVVRCGGEVALALAPAADRPWADAVQSMRRDPTRWDAAAERLAEAESTLTTAADHAVHAGLVGRLANTRGDFDRAADALEEAARHALEAGLVGRALTDLVTASHVVAQQLEDRDRASRLVARAEALEASYPVGRVLTALYGSQLLRLRGRHRDALAALDRAARWAGRLQIFERAVATDRAMHLGELGRFAEGAEALAHLAATETDISLRATQLMDAGWLAVLQHEATGAADLDAARGHLETALRLLREAEASAWLAEASLSLASLELRAGRLDRAGQHLAAARLEAPRAGYDTILWAHLLEARHAAALGDVAGAADRLRRLAEEARRVGRRGHLRLALADLGALLADAGAWDEAIATLELAEQVVDLEALDVRLGSGKGRFLGRSDDVAARLLGAHVAVDDAPRALAVVRRARRRPLAGVAAGARWERAPAPTKARWDAAVRQYRTHRSALEGALGDAWRWDPATSAARLGEADAALAAAEATLERAMSALGAGTPAPESHPAAGELWLTWAASDRGWVGLAATAGGVRGVPLPPPPTAPTDEALGAWLLTPFDAELADARAVHLLPTGGLRSVDLHALPWRGRPLLDALPVAWRLDVPGTPTPAAAARGALVVADPDGNLPGARAEGRRVAALLAEPGPVTARIGGEPRLDIAALSDLLGAHRHLHFAGHAIASGLDGWRSGLLLDRTLMGGVPRWSRLSPADILSLPRVPDSVVLAACESGGSESSTHADLDAARAFVLAGARWAIATSRTVSDADARTVAEALYADGVPDDPASALQRALSHARAASPHLDWRAWRVWVR